MALLGLNPIFWRDRRVLLTGHTGFKGGWLAVWLAMLDARVHGYALAPATQPALFQVARIETVLATHTLADVRDPDALTEVMARVAPEIVFHLAAQPLVRESYRTPVDTFATNVMGTVHLLEAVRQVPSVRAVVVITSDKCYLNRESGNAYVETDALGGHDPYSASKACAELATQAWRSAFLTDRVSVASARAGNVIGGGDWAEDRLVPDALRAWEKGRPVQVRYPGAVRPWQHVLEPLHGYLMLAERLHGGEAAEAWNFGPDAHDMVPVGVLLDRLAQFWGAGATWFGDAGSHPHEAGLLHLDSGKARRELGWVPRWSLDVALDRVVGWHRAFLGGEDMLRRCQVDIEDYQST